MKCLMSLMNADREGVGESSQEVSVDAHFIAMNARKDTHRLICHIWFIVIISIGAVMLLLGTR